MTIPFGPDSKAAYSVAPSISVQSSPSFDVGVLDTKTFTRGILAPIPVETFEYYWDQGWPKPLLLFLFIRTIEFKDDVGSWKKVENYPEDLKDLSAYVQKLKHVFPCAFSDTAAGSGISSVCRLKIKKVAAAEPVAPADLKAYSADATKVVQMMQSGFFLQKNSDNSYDLFLKSIYLETTDSKTGERKTRLCVRGSMINANGGLTSIPPPADTSCDVVLYMRSPEGMIYYLGELVRAETESDLLPAISECRIKGKSYPIFLGARTKAKDESAYVAVDYDDWHFSIPRNVDGAKANLCSMHSLSLVSQLLNQQKDLTELPFTGAVNVVGTSANPPKQ